MTAAYARASTFGQLQEQDALPAEESDEERVPQNRFRMILS